MNHSCLTFLLFDKIVSTENFPAPTINKKIEPRSIDQSVLASCAIFQKPSFNRIGIFVDEIATIIFTIIGIDANLVNNPINIKAPQRISNTPTKGAKNSGIGIPIFINLPTPSSSENKNFWIPSNKNTVPTINRIRIIDDENLLFI